MQSQVLKYEAELGEFGRVGEYTEYEVVARPYRLSEDELDHEEVRQLPWMIDVVVTIREIGDGGSVLNERTEADLYPTFWASEPTVAQLERDAQDVFDALIEELRIKAEDWADA